MTRAGLGVAVAAVGLGLAAVWGLRTAPSAALTVFAAASLADVLPTIAADWRDSGGGDVVFSFDATSRLARQLDAGAAADVFVAADDAWMDHAAAAGTVVADTRRAVAGNRLVLVVPSASPSVLPADLAGPTIARVAIAAEAVPAGRYARAALRHAGVWDTLGDRVVTGDDARTTLAWVARGEADAGVVYATDAAVEPAVRVTYTFPGEAHPPVRYAAAVLATASDADAAAAFVAHLAGEAARARFAAAGFTAP